jgi:hypothetical protein
MQLSSAAKRRIDNTKSIVTQYGITVVERAVLVCTWPVRWVLFRAGAMIEEGLEEVEWE